MVEQYSISTPPDQSVDPVNQDPKASETPAGVPEAPPANEEQSSPRGSSGSAAVNASTQEGDQAEAQKSEQQQSSDASDRVEFAEETRKTRELTLQMSVLKRANDLKKREIVRMTQELKENQEEQDKKTAAVLEAVAEQDRRMKTELEKKRDEGAKDLGSALTSVKKIEERKAAAEAKMKQVQAQTEEIALKTRELDRKREDQIESAWNAERAYRQAQERTQKLLDQTSKQEEIARSLSSRPSIRSPNQSWQGHCPPASVRSPSHPASGARPLSGPSLCR